MNHLAHLFLSGEDPGVIAGNFITDLLKPVEQRAMTGKIQEGIKLHLFIDTTIDHDPVFKESIRLIHPRQGGYAPVVADIFYDFLLAHHWDIFSVMDFNGFKQRMYDTLSNLMVNPVPELVQQRVKSMINHDFLSSYTDFEYIPHAFGLLKKRASFENKFDQASEDFSILYPDLNTQFLVVFPMMINKIKAYGISLQNSKRS